MINKFQHRIVVSSFSKMSVTSSFVINDYQRTADKSSSRLFIYFFFHLDKTEFFFTNFYKIQNCFFLRLTPAADHKNNELKTVTCLMPVT